MGTQQVQSAESEVAQAHAAQQATEATASRDVAQAKSAQHAAEAKAAQEIHSAESEATEAQAAQKTAVARSDQLVHAAESKAAEARSEQKEEEAKDTQFIHFLDSKTAKKVEAAKTEAAQAESAKNDEKEKKEEMGYHVTVFAAFLTCTFLLLTLWTQKTLRGRAFKERMSERLSGMVGKKNEKKQPLLPKQSPDPHSQFKVSQPVSRFQERLVGA